MFSVSSKSSPWVKRDAIGGAGSRGVVGTGALDADSRREVGDAIVLIISVYDFGFREKF
jgi:hypothetical protein